MLKFWKERNTNEKVMMVFIAIMLIIIALNWKDVFEGFKDGVANKPTDKTIVE